MSKSYGIKNFVRIAQEYTNSKDLNSVEEISKFLIGWFCIQYNTTFYDPRLQELTIEELLVLYNINRIKDNPNYATEILTPVKETYEEWLRKEMGEDYISEEEVIKAADAEERAYLDSLKEQLPSKITTDFTQFSKK